MLSERLHVLSERFRLAKLSGSTDVGEQGVYCYRFRSNGQAADLATTVVAEWLREHTVRKLDADLDSVLFIERIATALRDAESEWRNHEVADRDDYANKFIYQAESVIEELEK